MRIIHWPLKFNPVGICILLVVCILNCTTGCSFAHRPIRTTYPDIPPYPGAILISAENPDVVPTEYKHRVFSHRAPASSGEILAYYRHHLEQLAFTITYDSDIALRSVDESQCPIVGIGIDILTGDGSTSYRVVQISDQCERR